MLVENPMNIGGVFNENQYVEVPGGRIGQIVRYENGKYRVKFPQGGDALYESRYLKPKELLRG